MSQPEHDAPDGIHRLLITHKSNMPLDLSANIALRISLGRPFGKWGDNES
jgi:hypothetical protein